MWEAKYSNYHYAGSGSSGNLITEHGVVYVTDVSEIIILADLRKGFLAMFYLRNSENLESQNFCPKI